MTIDDHAITETFSHFQCTHTIEKEPILLPAFVSGLLEGITTPKPVIDDRMFVLSMIMSDDISSRLTRWDDNAEKYAYENDDLWYKMVFVDSGDKTCQSRHMSADLIKATTYDRWVRYGTLYGISRYSFIAASKGDWFSRNILLPHMKTMYFQIFTLLLSYRAVIIAFSGRVANAVDRQKQGESLTDLYDDYLFFMNKHFFREVTAQEQGVELYKQAMAIMQIQ